MAGIRTPEQFTAELVAEAAKARSEMSKIVRAAAFELQGLARVYAPVDTGNLRASISVGHPSGRSLQVNDIEAQIGPTAEYGAYVEFGTSRMGGRPYMTPAAEAVVPAFEQRVRDFPFSTP